METSTNDVALTATQPATKKPKKLSKGTLYFIDMLKYQFPDEELDFTVNEAREFVDPTVAKYFKIYSKGRDAQRYFEPELFILGKLTDAGEIQFSDQPKVMKSPHMAQVAVDRMTRRFGGTYLYFGLSRAWAQSLAKKLLLDGTHQLEQLKVYVRPNHKAK